MKTRNFNGGEFRVELLNNQFWLKLGVFLLVVSGLLILFSFYGPRLIFSYASSLGFFIASIVLLIHAFKFWKNKLLGLFLHVMAALISGFIAYKFFIANDQNFVVILWILAFSYFLFGIFRIYTANAQGIIYLGWQWTFLCGVVNLLLVGVIFFLAATPIFMIPFICAIDYIFTGIALMSLGFGANRLAYSK